MVISGKIIMKENILNEVEKYLFLLDEKLETEKENLIEKYVIQLTEILNKTKEIQQSRKFGKISGISFILSRINIAHSNYAYPVFMFNDVDYLDIDHDKLAIDASFFYEYLEEIKQSTLSKCRRYVEDNIDITEVEQELYKYLKYFNMFFVHMLRNIFEKEEIKNILTTIELSDLFVVLQGELSEKPYFIYECKKEAGEGD